MLTLQQIKSNPAEVVERLAIKGFDGKEAIDKVLALDEQRRLLQLDNDNKAAELNRIAASIGSLMKEGKREEAEQAKSQVAGLKEAQRTIAGRTRRDRTGAAQPACDNPQPPLRHGATRHIGS